MKSFTGYLTAIHNPYFSGLATVYLRSDKRPGHGRELRTHCEAGFGVRQLVAAFGKDAEKWQETKARFDLDEFGCLASVEVVE